MRIVNLYMRNYGPFYGFHEFNLENKGLTLILGKNNDELKMDSNGSGKSSLFDALDWGLWGKIPRNDHADSIISEGEKECSVGIKVVNDHNQIIEIARERKSRKSILTLLVDGKDISNLDIKITQTNIEKYLGLNRDTFHATVLFGQTDLVRYADSSDSQRMEILTQILQLDFIDSFLEKTKDIIKKEDLETSNVIGRVDALELQYRQIKKEIEGKKERIIVWEEAQQEKIKTLISLLHEKQQVLNSFGRLPDISNLYTRKEELKQQIRNYEPFQTLPCYKGYIDEKNKISIARGILVDKVNTIARQLAQLGKKDYSVCPTCGQPVDVTHIKKEIEFLETDRSQSITVIKEYDYKLRVLEDANLKNQQDYTKQIQEMQRYNDEIEKQRQEIEASITDYRVRQEQFQYMDQEIRRINGEIEARKQESNPWVVEVNSLQIKRKNLKNDLKEGSATIDKFLHRKILLEFWVKAFGAKGIKSYILDLKLRELSEAVNYWIRILTGGTIWVEFASEKKTRSDKTVNSPDVRVFRWNPDGTITERNYRSWSGGEKQRISFAIDFGLSTLIANRAEYRYDILVLDEVFKHLDLKGKESIVTMLHELARDKSSIFVIDHDPDFKNQFEKTILIEKTNGRSFIKEL